MFGALCNHVTCECCIFNVVCDENQILTGGAQVQSQKKMEERSRLLNGDQQQLSGRRREISSCPVQCYDINNVRHN